MILTSIPNTVYRRYPSTNSLPSQALSCLAHLTDGSMAASSSALFSNLLSQNEALTTANLELQREVETLKQLQFRQEILAKHLEIRIKELGASIKAQAIDNSTWLTQIEQLLVTVNGQVEQVLTSLRARSAGDDEASQAQGTPAAVNEQPCRLPPLTYENMLDSNKQPRRLPRLNDENENFLDRLIATRDRADLDSDDRAGKNT